MPLDLNFGDAILTPMDIPKEIKLDGTIEDLGECQWRAGRGYVYNNNIYQEGHVCLKPDSGKCHYHLKIVFQNHFVIVQITQNCICLRSRCNRFTVNKFYVISQIESVNICVCNVYSIIRCDIYLVSNS